MEELTIRQIIEKAKGEANKTKKLIAPSGCEYEVREKPEPYLFLRVGMFLQAGWTTGKGGERDSLKQLSPEELTKLIFEIIKGCLVTPQLSDDEINDLIKYVPFDAMYIFTEITKTLEIGGGDNLQSFSAKQRGNIIRPVSKKIRKETQRINVE